MTNLTVKEEKQINWEGHPASITTNQDNDEIRPTMLGVYTGGSYVAKAYINLNQNLTEIPLEACTINHFSTVPNIDLINTSNNLSQYLCLTMNKTYDLGGAHYSNLLKSIDFYLNCTNQTQCSASPDVNVIVQESFVNPGDNKTPWISYYSFFPSLYSNSTLRHEIYDLRQSVLEEDRSVVPLQNAKSTTSGFQVTR